MIIAVAFGLLTVAGFLFYNQLIAKKNEVDNANGSLDAQLKQRYDLIPNLVATVRRYMNHEFALLQKVVELRSQASAPGISDADRNEVNSQIAKGLTTIMVQAEQYPELKSNVNFVSLQNTLYDVEENIAASRRFYNTAVTEYNNAIEMVPTNIIARMMGLARREVFSIPELERKNVSVAQLFKDDVA